MRPVPCLEALRRPAISHGLQLALDACSGKYAKLAKAAGVNRRQVDDWINRGRGRIPAEYVLRLEQSLGISRHLLRPDIYPGGAEEWLAHAAELGG